MSWPRSSLSGVNHLTGVEEFIRQWDNPAEADLTADPVSRNAEPAPGMAAGEASFCRTAPILTRWHPSFRGALEPGVRELVLQVINTLACITYSSCEGHCHEGAPMSFSVRQVGIVPRDATEHERLLRILHPVVYATNAPPPLGHVRVGLRSGVLSSEGLERPCIDVVFLPEKGHENDYFRELEPVYDAFLRLLTAAGADLGKLSL